MNKRKAASSVEGAAFLSFRGIVFHHTSCASGRLPYVGVNDWPQPVHGTMTSIVPYKLFAAFAAIGKVSPQRDEGIPPYRTVNDSCFKSPPPPHHRILCIGQERSHRGYPAGSWSHYRWQNCSRLLRRRLLFFAGQAGNPRAGAAMWFES